MWAEARKQERKIRGMLVDYRKRAERRQDFYEKIKADPTQFMQIHGRRCKIHLDPAVAAAGESPAIMMPWQGHADNLIDRFDVRAHLDYIPPVIKTTEPPEYTQEERLVNYESFRILAQNDFLGINEDKYLHQLHLEEQYGVNAQQLELDKAKKKSNSSINSGGAAIGYTYEDDSYAGDQNSSFNAANIIASAAGGNAAQDESDSDIDVDVSIDINKIDTQQAHELNGCGRHYGMQSNDFYSFLTKDADEAESLRMAREEEQEKIMLCGRKSRRERRAQREKRFAGRTISPPSYAAKEEPVKADEAKNDSDSRSPTPENTGKITYITSFGGEDELTTHSKISINFNKVGKGTLGSELASTHFGNAAKKSNESVSYADKVKQNLEKLKHLNDQPKTRKPLAYQRRGHSRSRSRSRSRDKLSYHRNYRGNSSRSRYRHRSHSRSRSSPRRQRPYRRSRSRDKTRNRRRRYSSSSSSSSASRRHSKKRRSLSSSSSSSSSSKSSNSTRSPVRRRSKSRSKSLERKNRHVGSTSQTKELKSKPMTEKPTVTNQIPIVTTTPISIPTLTSTSTPTPTPTPITTAPVIPAPIEVLPPETPLIREEQKLPEVQVPIKKYYGRKRETQNSSSEDELSYEETESTEKNKSETTSSTIKSVNLGKAATIHTKDTSGTSKPTLNPRDRLKKKMQILLNKQYKADKMAEIEKNERQIQQQQERDDEMREMALRLRRRQRELRHKYGSPVGESDKSDGSVSESNRSSVSRSNRESPKHKTQYRSRSRSRSRSYDTRRDRRAKYTQRRHSRENSRHRRSQDRSRRRSTSRDYRRRSKSPERRRNNDRPRKLVDY